MNSQNESDKNLITQFVNFLVGLPIDTPRPTDEQIRADIKKEWLAVLRRLWLAFDKKIESEQFELYVEELGDIPLGLLEGGIKAIIDNPLRGTYFPRLSELKQAISQEMKKDITDGRLDQDNIDEWIRVQDEKFYHRCNWKAERIMDDV